MADVDAGFRLVLFSHHIDFKMLFLQCVIGRRGMTIQLPPASLAKNSILKSAQKYG